MTPGSAHRFGARCVRCALDWGMIPAARILLAAITLGAIGWQLRTHMMLGFDVLNFFSYFTNLANITASAVLILSALRGKDFERSVTGQSARLASAVNMAIVGVVFSTLLRNVDLGTLAPWVNAIVHYVMPCAVVADWLLRPSPFAIPVKHALLATLVFPAAYLTYTVVRGHWLDWYPYPFLNPAMAGGGLAVAGYAAAIAVVYVGAMLLLRMRSRSQWPAGVRS